MKTFSILAALLALPTLAEAHVSCAGETYGAPTIVQVDVNTVGTMGGIVGGRVTITPKDGTPRSYELAREDITQFFEATTGPNEENVVVGLSAFVGTEYPVYIRFVGPNEQRDDLAQALRNEDRKKRDEPMKKSGRNSLLAWMGPGYPADQQHSFKDVVCTVWLDP